MMTKLLRKKAGPIIILCCFLSTLFSTFGGEAVALAATQNLPQSYKPQNTYLSPIKKAPMAFTGLGANWHTIEPEGTKADLSVRFLTSEKWSDWQLLEGDIDGKTEQSEEYPTAFIATNLATSFQYKIVLSTEDPSKTPLIENIEFTYLNAHEKVGSDLEKATFSEPVKTSTLSSSENIENKSATIAAKTPKKTGRLKIISRKEWGADEIIRYYHEDVEVTPAEVNDKKGGETKDNENAEAKEEPKPKKIDPAELKLSKTITKDPSGEVLTWPLEYSAKVSKIIIHHTASSKNLDNPEQAIRDIYYWHAMTKGWGDIGYNYLIDPDGNVYEGRYGGEGIVGAHAANANIGSIGIAVLGNYEENKVPDAVVDSLVALLKLKTDKYAIDPLGTSTFRGERLPNIMGHHDVRATSCPGENLYDLLPVIRSKVKGELKPTFVDNRRTDIQKEYDYDLVTNVPVISLEPGQKKNLSITLTNTGKKQWGPETTLVVNNTADSKNFFDSVKTISSAALGKTVAQGEKASFTVPLQVKKYNGGYGYIELFPFVNGTTKIEKYLKLPLQITSPQYDYETVSIEVKKDKLKPGEETDVTIILKNNGNVSWKRSGSNMMSLGSEKPRDHYSQLLQRPAQRLARLKESEVKPGQKGTFLMKLKAPQFDGVYREYFGPVIEKITWLPFNENNYFEVTVGNPSSKNMKKDKNDKTSPGILKQKINKNIRVDLGFKGEPLMTSDSNFQLLEGTKEKAQFTKNEKVKVSYKEGKYEITAAEKNFTLQMPPRFKAENGIMRIDNYEHHPSWKPELNDNEYRGVLEVNYYQAELHVINELPVEEYLKGLAEISAKDPSEKIKAVLIAARTYAYYYTTVAEKFPGAPFNLTDDPEKSQIYLGYGFEKRSPTGVKAVKATAGLVVAYKEKLVKTPYFSSDDGRTKSAEEVWGWTDTPYLKSVDDPGCKGQPVAGHGVGLSGCGALYFANQGQTAEEIIKYYYQGAELKKISP